MNEIVNGYLNMELLRFTTAGSVDDGKSTLIGRLLYDSKAIFEDQLKALEKASLLKGEENINLALLTDGLKAEREQGITIDVAYRYFATPKRKFIIADTPGHIQYTRNMVTGASTANLALILVDARNGVVEQTIRHAFIASLLQIPHVVVCINKMDLVDFNEERYHEITQQFLNMATKLDVKDIRFIPISALKGDNIVKRSQNMPWYEGPTLMWLLETIYISSDINYIDARFPVQYIIRPQSKEFHDYRGYAGRVASGVFRKGDKVKILPGGFSSIIKSIDTFEASHESAYAQQSVCITLEDDIDISRGDMIVKENNVPTISQDVEMMFCWFNEKPLQLKGKYILRHTTNEVKCMVNEIRYKVDMTDLHRKEDDKEIKMNDIGRLSLRLQKPIFYDSYRKNRNTGSVILVDEATNETVAAGMIV
ncbi:MAG TPA: sulfate adenylyltransferase subunit CysN [Bacteroidales bacterium]|jgi:sulfate adenylyltransferase subunit 1|nr:sulfate adenylyltransferase subunit CysN [Bacteroidales bacterium]